MYRGARQFRDFCFCFEYIVLQVFEDSGVKLITDLPISRSCNIITDAVNEGDIDYEVAHSSSFADVSNGGK